MGHEDGLKPGPGRESPLRRGELLEVAPGEVGEGEELLLLLLLLLLPPPLPLPSPAPVGGGGSSKGDLRGGLERERQGLLPGPPRPRARAPKRLRVQVGKEDHEGQRSPTRTAVVVDGGVGIGGGEEGRRRGSGWKQRGGGAEGEERPEDEVEQRAPPSLPPPPMRLCFLDLYRLPHSRRRPRHNLHPDCLRVDVRGPGDFQKQSRRREPQGRRRRKGSGDELGRARRRESLDPRRRAGDVSRGVSGEGSPLVEGVKVSVVEPKRGVDAVVGVAAECGAAEES